METVITNGNLHGDSQGLPDREVVRQAQKNLSMNAKFWVLIKHNRIPYKIVDGKLIEASYTEAVKGIRNPPVLNIYWLTDQEFDSAQVSAEQLAKALLDAGEAKNKLDLFKHD